MAPEQTRARTRKRVFTIGHSNHTIEAFLDVLCRQQIEMVVDVRSSPYSQYALQFNQESLQYALEGKRIGYLFLGDALGGRPHQEQFYDQEGFVLYDRLAESPQFQSGIGRLLRTLGAGRVVILCGEEDPTDCHRRRLIGRVLAERDVELWHLRGDGRVQSEEEVAREEQFRKTKGQKTLFDVGEPDRWRSTRSVSPRKAQPSSSIPCDEPESGG
jgi:uncharacterized protein (DUF488 family)